MSFTNSGDTGAHMSRAPPKTMQILSSKDSVELDYFIICSTPRIILNCYRSHAFNKQ